MKNWVRPMAVEENLLSDAAVAVGTCYRVKCDIDSSNTYERNHNNKYAIHRNKYCGNIDNQVIQTRDGYITGIKEINANWDGNAIRDSQLYTDDTYKTPLSATKVQEGQRVYWMNHAQSFIFFNFDYHHQGNIELVSEAHKNMS